MRGKMSRRRWAAYSLFAACLALLAACGEDSTAARDARWKEVDVSHQPPPGHTAPAKPKTKKHFGTCSSDDLVNFTCDE